MKPIAGIGFVRHLLLGLAALALVAAAALAIAVGTSSGTAFLLDAAQRLAGQKLAIDSATGTLLTGLAAQQVAIRTDRVTIALADVAVEVDWPAVLRRTLAVRRASAGRLTIDVRPRTAEPDSGPVVLPFAISAAELRVKELVVTAGGTPVELADIDASGTFAAGVVRISRATLSAYGFNASAAGTLGTGKPYSVQGQVRWRRTDSALAGAGAVGGSLEQLDLVQVVQMPEAVAVRGSLALLAAPITFRAEATWPELGWSRSGVGDIASTAGRLTVAGSFNDYVARLTSTIRVGNSPPGQLTGTGRGDWRALRIERFTAGVLGGNVEGDGTLVLDAWPGGRFRLVGRNLNPAFLDRRFDGRVTLAAGAGFDRDGNASIAVERATGRLFGRSLSASGAMTRRGGEIVFDRLRLVNGRNRVSVDGSLRDQWRGRFQIDAPELATLWPGLRGAVDGAGEFAGTAAQPVFDVKLRGRDVGWQDVLAKRFGLAASLGTSGRLDVQADAVAIRIGARQLGGLQARILGRPARSDFSLTADGPDGRLRLAGTGGVSGQRLAATVNSAAVVVRGAGEWQLERPVQFAADTSKVSVGAHCWTDAPAELCVSDSELARDRQRGGATLANFPLARVAPLVDPQLTLEGTADAQLDFVRVGDQVTGSLRWRQQGTRIGLPGPDGETVQTRIEQLSVSVDADGRSATLVGELTDGYGIQLNARGTIEDPLADTAQLRGELTGVVPDLRKIESIAQQFADIGDLRGRIAVTANLSGRLRAPDIAGGIVLSGASFSVPLAGIKVSELQLAIRGGQDGVGRVTGSARSGPGRIALGGELQWRDSLIPTGILTVTGQDFEIIRLPEGMAQVSPDARVRVEAGNLVVSGDVEVPKADIRLTALGEGAAVASPDIVVHGRDEAIAATAQPTRFVVDGLRVALGRSVRFEGFGLSTLLGGRLVLSQSRSAGSTLNADGVVQLKEGKFAALGQELTIDRGTLAFSGAATDPGVAVRASRKVDYEGRQVTVGLLLSGTLSRIQTRLFSDPAMSEVDALSYLTSGRPLAAVGAGDRNTISNAAMSLGLRGALPVAQKLGSALRLDEVAVGGRDFDNTEVMVGERIGKDLFVRYSYGIFNKIGTIRATYRLNRRFSIEGTSGESQGLDLLYSVSW